MKPHISKRFKRSRPLQPGETIQKFDQYLNPSTGSWVESGCVGQVYNPKPGGHCKHRRFI